MLYPLDPPALRSYPSWNPCPSRPISKRTHGQNLTLLTTATGYGRRTGVGPPNHRQGGRKEEWKALAISAST